MTDKTPMHAQVNTLPKLVRDVIHPFDESARGTFDFETCTSVKRIYLVGCGDSHHAPVGTELAFNQLTGVPSSAHTSMTFSHYAAAYMPKTGPNTNMVITVSVSGGVSRTIEAQILAREAGAIGIALTGNPDARLAQNSGKVFQTTVPPLPDELQGIVVPGVRSYLASQVALYLAAIRIGEVNGNLTTAKADGLRAELRDIADIMEATISTCTPICAEVVSQWQDATEFVFVGVGPNYGTAMFSAAKMLEASGDPSMAQETEEWAHLQYFATQPDTPTILITPSGVDAARSAEVAFAMKAIGRRTAGILPENENTLSQHLDHVLPIRGDIRECFSPLVYSIPGELLAAERAHQIGAVYFRNFEGGRAIDGEPRTSRIYDSEQLSTLPDANL